MEKNICIKNHDKIVAIYKEFTKPGAEVEFADKIRMLKSSVGVITVTYFIDTNWESFLTLIEIIRRLCNNSRNIGDKELATFICSLNADMSEVKNKTQLFEFFYKVIDRKHLFGILKKLFKILSNKNQCLAVLFSK